MPRSTFAPVHFSRCGAALLAAALVGGLGACSAKTAPTGTSEELAELRQEQQALRDEIAALRWEIVRLTEVLAAGQPADAAAVAPPPAEHAAYPPYMPASTTPVTVITAVIDDYRAALEAEDLGRMQTQVYQGTIPTSDVEYLQLWFDRTEGLRVEMDPLTIDFENGTATAVIRQTMNYTLIRTAERRRVHLDLRMEFERRGDGWRLASARLRR
jgi:hypothetical protein